MRREDLSKADPSNHFFSSQVANSALVIPYKEPSAEKPDDIANTMATTLPMVAVSLAQPCSLIRLTREDVYKEQVRYLTPRKYHNLAKNHFPFTRMIGW